MVVEPRADRPITIIGAGVFVAAGYNVHLCDIAPDTIQEAVTYIDDHKEEFKLMPRISKVREPVRGAHGFTEVAGTYPRLIWSLIRMRRLGGTRRLRRWGLQWGILGWLLRLYLYHPYSP